MTYAEWCAAHQCSHGHCAGANCEHPQPVWHDGRLVCGRCLVMCGEAVDMRPCGAECVEAADGSGDGMTALKFHDVVTPANVLAQHAEAGGEGLRRMVADLPDGELRVMMAREPFGAKLGWHISASVGRVGEIGPFRAPTDDEMKAAAALLEMDAEAAWYGRVALEEDNEGSTACFTRHLWER